MRSRFRPRITFANVVSLVALFMATGGAALAASGFVGSNGQIQGCVSGKGRLVLVKPGKQCKKGTSKIAWNQLGPRGATGAAGAPCASTDPLCKGPKGDQGDTGPAGGSALVGRVTGVPGDCGFCDTDSFGGLSGTAPFNATLGNVEQQSPDLALVATNLSVFQTTTPPGGNRTFTLLVNGSPTTLTCEPPSGGPGCTSDATVSIPANAALALKIHGHTGSATNPGTDVRVGVRLQTP